MSPKLLRSPGFSDRAGPRRPDRRARNQDRAAQADIEQARTRTRRTIRGPAPTSRARRRGSTGRLLDRRGPAGPAGLHRLAARRDHQALGAGRERAAATLAGLADLPPINQVTSVLPKAFDDARFALLRQARSTARPRSRRATSAAIAAVNDALGDAVGQLYAARYFPASSKAEIQAMVKNIVAAFDSRIAELDWMAPATKDEARKQAVGADRRRRLSRPLARLPVRST